MAPSQRTAVDVPVALLGYGTVGAAVHRLLLENAEELALLEPLDMGKPISDSLNVDVASCANNMQWYAECIDKLYGEIAPIPRDSVALIEREPMGVVGAVVPWNYPLMMASWKLGPALAAGPARALPSHPDGRHEMRLLSIDRGVVVLAQFTTAKFFRQFVELLCRQLHAQPSGG